jgi:hypothetical protein
VAGFCGFIDSVENLHKNYAVLCGRDTFAVAEAGINEVLNLTREKTVEVECGIAEGLDIDKGAVHIAEIFNLRADLRACLCAEKLDFAAVTYLEKIEMDGDTAVATRDIGTGVETCRVKLPALFTVTEKFGELRPFAMRRVMKYKNHEPEVLSCDDIGAEADRCGFAGSPTSVNKIVSVVLAGGDYQEVPATDEGISALVQQLTADHTIG